MYPLFLPEDRAQIQKSNLYTINDIIAFRKKNKLIAHRIVHIFPDGDHFITKGDNNMEPDGIIGRDKILGKVSAIKRGKNLINLDHFYLTQSSFYLSQLKLINKLFGKKKLRYIILRGIIPYIYYLKKIPRRLYNDCDILVRNNDFQTAIKALETAGFKKLTPSLFRRELENPTETTLVKNLIPFPVQIDLHRCLGIPFTKVTNLNALFPKLIDFEKTLFRNTSKANIQSQKFPILTKEILFIYLILHWYKHNFVGLYRIDLANSLIKTDFDWRKVLKIVRKYQLESIVFMGIFFLKKYFQTQIPQEFLLNLKVNNIKKTIISGLANLITPFKATSKARAGAKKVALLMFLSPSTLSEKLKILLSRKNLGLVLPTISSIVLTSFFKTSKSRFLSEDSEFHYLNPGSKTKSISL